MTWNNPARDLAVLLSLWRAAPNQSAVTVRREMAKSNGRRLSDLHTEAIGAYTDIDRWLGRQSRRRDVGHYRLVQPKWLEAVILFDSNRQQSHTGLVGITESEHSLLLALAHDIDVAGPGGGGRARLTSEQGTKLRATAERLQDWLKGQESAIGETLRSQLLGHLEALLAAVDDGDADEAIAAAAVVIGLLQLCAEAMSDRGWEPEAETCRVWLKEVVAATAANVLGAAIVAGATGALL